jgi:hypothetical protein
MKTNTLLCIISLALLIGLSSCRVNTLTYVQQVALMQAKELIDSGCIKYDYIHIEKILMDDYSSLYFIQTTDSPYSTWYELPSKIVPYKGKYICYTELDEPEMAKFKMESITHDTLTHLDYEIDGRRWYLGISKHNRTFTIVENLIPNEWTNIEDSIYIDYPQLWSYIPGYTKSAASLSVFLHSTDIWVSMRSEMINLDSIKRDIISKHAWGMYGKMHLINNTDAPLDLYQHNSPRLSCKIVNGKDTLQFLFKDSLPRQLLPKEVFEIRYQSLLLPENLFFAHLTKEDPWSQLFALVQDSSFCFWNKSDEPKMIKMMHGGAGNSFMVKDIDCSSLSFRVLPKGVFDKNERERINTTEWLN